MPWNGSGVFARIYSWAADRDAGLDILADRMDTDTDDIAQGLMHCLTVNGETVPTANLPMANFRHTGAAAGVADTDYATLGQIKNGGGGLAGGFLPLSGGTIAGPLTVAQNRLVVSGGSSPSLALVNTAGGGPFGMWSAAGFLAFGLTDTSGAPQGSFIRMDAGGNTTFTAAVTVDGAITGAANRLIASGGSSPSVTLVNTAGGGPYAMWNGSNFLHWGIATTAGAPTTGLMSLDASGNLAANGQITGAGLSVGGNAAIGGALNAGAASVGALNVSGVLNSTGNRIILQGGAAPSITINNTAGGGPFAMWNASGFLEWGTADAAGNPGTTLMYVDGNGQLYIRGTGLSYQGLAPNHGVGFQWTGSALNAFIDGGNAGQVQLNPSDERLKTNILPASRDALAALRQVELYSFDRKSLLDPRAGPVRHDEIGFVARQLRTAIPEAVTEAGEEAMLSLDLLPLTAYLVGAVQQLSRRLDALEGARS